MAWLSGYTYGKIKPVNSTTAGAKTNYQKILLVGESAGASGEEIDCEDHCHDFPNDIRFTAADGVTKHDYWVESITGTTPNRLATILIEIASIPASGDIDLYMYYGKTSDSGESNGNNTFLFFDDCETGVASDKWESVLGSPSFSYHDVLDGIWYQNGDYYHGPMATYSSKHRPMAIYVSSQNKTYFVYGSINESAEISYYDHSAETFCNPITIGSIADGNAHRNPSLLIDESGYIYIFYGSHTGTCYCKRSSSAYDISSWDTKASISDGHTFPQAWQLKSGEIIHLYRAIVGASRKEYYRISTDGVTSWGSATNLVDFGINNWIYLVSIAGTGSYTRKLHTAWTIYNTSTSKREDIFYAKTEDGGTTWKEADGTSYTLPITSLTAEKVFESGTDECYMKDIQLDSSGNVYILFSTGSANSWTVKIAKYSGGTWSNYTVCTHDHPFDSGALVILASSDFRVYFPSTSVQANNDGGEVEEWKSVDGGENWSNTAHITSSSTYSHNYIRTVFNSASDGKFRVFWGYADSIKDTANTNVSMYMYGEQGAKTLISHEKYLRITGGASENVVRAKNCNLADAIFEAKVLPGGTNPGYSVLGGRVTAAGYHYNVRASHSGNSKVYKYTGSWTALDLTGTAKDILNWHLWSIKIENYNIKFDWDYEQLISTSDGGSSIANGAIGARVYSSNIGLDNIRVREYCNPEPTWGSSGSELTVARSQGYIF